MVSHSPWSQQAPDPKWGDSNPPIPIFLDFPHLSWNELFTPDAALLPIWRSCVRGGNLPLTKGGPRWPGNHLRIRKERHRSARAPMCAEHRDAVPLAVADHCDPAPASGLPLRPSCSSARGLATGASGKPLPPGTNKHRTQKGEINPPFRISSNLPIFHGMSDLHQMRPSCPFGGLALLGALCPSAKGGTPMSTQSARNQEGAAPADPRTYGH